MDREEEEERAGGGVMQSEGAVKTERREDGSRGKDGAKKLKEI